MEGAYVHNMGPTPFFYYNPEPQSEHRQHGHFSPHPQYSGPINFYPELIKPMSHQYSHAQQQQYPVRSPPIIYSNGMYPQSMLTPLASPQPVYHRPTVLIDRQSSSLYQLNTDCNPSTPPLSAAGSARNSPPSACLPTPANATFAVPQAFSGIKKGCEGEVFTEILSTNDWRSPSPPLTPVFIYPKAEASHGLLLSSVDAHHPISPAPSPPPFSISSLDPTLSFCDPRDLTVRCSPEPPFDFSLHADSNQLSHSHSTKGIIPDFISTLPTDFLGAADLPSDSLFGLEIDNDFGCFDACASANDAFFPGHKRQRTELISFPSEEDHFLATEDSFSESDEDHLASAWFLNPSDLENSFCSDMSTVAKSGRHTPMTSNASDAESEAEYTNNSTSETAHGNNQGSSASVEGQNGTSEHTMGSGSDDATTKENQSSSRRGRKQSLTDDPSKTFICTLCNRRFRRQEHLKRHYRSLHTHDKPFKCNDCGKSFSRSDNLAQHQRTHGTGTIELELNDPEDTNAEGPMSLSPTSDSDRMAQILYQAAVRLAAPTTSESSSSVSDESDVSLTAPSDKKIRKRKRDE